MCNIEFFHNDPDNFHDTKLTLHDCFADKITYSNNILSFDFPDGFWVCSNHEDSNLSKTVRTDSAKVDFTVTPDQHFEIYLDVFKKRKYLNTIVEYWDIDKLMDAVNGGKYQLEFVYQYRTHFEQMWLCYLHYQGCMYRECQLHIPYSTATYRWNNLREECVW